MSPLNLFICIVVPQATWFVVGYVIGKRHGRREVALNVSSWIMGFVKEIRRRKCQS